MKEQRIIDPTQTTRRADSTDWNAASPHRTGHSTGIHSDDRPRLTDEPQRRQQRVQQMPTPPIEYQYDDGEDHAIYDTRSPSSARRYPINDAPTQRYVVTCPRQQSVRRPDRYDNVNVYVRRRSAPAPRPQQAAPRTTQQSEQDDDEQETEPLRTPTQQRQKWRFHWLVYVGGGMVAMVILWFVLSSVFAWWGTYQDDLHYGRPRTYQCDATVGHNDAQTPSHFIALNLHRHIEVIEFPGGEASHAKVYLVSSMLQEGNDLAVVTLDFKDLTHNGKLDMIITVGNDKFVFINANGQFRPVEPGDNITTL